MINIPYSHLYGLTDSHLVLYEQIVGDRLSEHRLTKATLAAFKQMQTDARAQGIEIALCSSYRDYHRQAAIWNGKASGTRSVLDANSQPLDISLLSETQLRDAILQWSALPGCSRHHWGTDFDIYDAAQISASQLQLIPEEYQGNGPCQALSLWLTNNAHHYGFYRPYQAGLSGVQFEPWHLSYFPESDTFIENFEAKALRQVLEQYPLALQQSILNELEQLVENYVYFIAPSPSKTA